MLPIIIEPTFGMFQNTGRSPDVVRGAWANNRDFKIVGGPYINKRDYQNHAQGQGGEFHSGVLRVTLEGRDA